MIAPTPLRDDRGGMDWLGPEFLTWLWWRAERAPRFFHPDGTEVWVHLDEHLELRGERAASRRTVLRAGMPGASMEAKAALRSGKLLVAARLLLARGEHEVRFTLKAEDLDVSGLALPAPDGADAAERGATLLDDLDGFFADLDLCLSNFLEVRCGAGWTEEVRRLHAWVAEESRDIAVSASRDVAVSASRDVAASASRGPSEGGAGGPVNRL